MNESIILWAIILVVVVTSLVIISIFCFGKFLFNQRIFESQKNLMNESVMTALEKTNYTISLFRSLNNILRDFDEKRNDFWTIYGQIIICLFIICIIALLLLTKVISPEAGLPILSAISGFAIAKGSTVKNNPNDNINDNR